MMQHNEILTPTQGHQKTQKTPRPRLTAETVVDYLDWVCENAERMSESMRHAHLTAAELAIRTRMGEAQAKATHATLVEQGTIDPATNIY